MQEFKKNIEDIRHAQWGRDVREAMAQALEQALSGDGDANIGEIKTRLDSLYPIELTISGQVKGSAVVEEGENISINADVGPTIGTPDGQPTILQNGHGFVFLNPGSVDYYRILSICIEIGTELKRGVVIQFGRNEYVGFHTLIVGAIGNSSNRTPYAYFSGRQIPSWISVGVATRNGKEYVEIYREKSSEAITIYDVFSPYGERNPAYKIIRNHGALAESDMPANRIKPTQLLPYVRTDGTAIFPRTVSILNKCNLVGTGDVFIDGNVRANIVYIHTGNKNGTNYGEWIGLMVDSEDGSVPFLKLLSGIGSVAGIHITSTTISEGRIILAPDGWHFDDVSKAKSAAIECLSSAWNGKPLLQLRAANGNPAAFRLYGPLIVEDQNALIRGGLFVHNALCAGSSIVFNVNGVNPELGIGDKQCVFTAVDYSNTNYATNILQLSRGNGGTCGLYVIGFLIVEQNIECRGDLSVAGAKNRIVETENYGTRTMSAVESTECRFEDQGSAVIEDSGVCVVNFDPIFAETIEVDLEYQVFTQKTSKGLIDYVQKETGYFIVYGDPGTTFDWNVSCRQKGYGSNRMDEFEKKGELHGNGSVNSDGSEQNNE